MKIKISVLLALALLVFGMAFVDVSKPMQDSYPPNFTPNSICAGAVCQTPTPLPEGCFFDPWNDIVRCSSGESGSYTVTVISGIYATEQAQINALATQVAVTDQPEPTQKPNIAYPAPAPIIGHSSGYPAPLIKDGERVDVILFWKNVFERLNKVKDIFLK